MKVDKLLNKDWNNINISKYKKKSLRNRLALYVKATKTMSKCCTNCLDWIEQIWSVANWNKFAQLYYFRSNKLFFCYIIIIIKLSLTFSCCQKAIKKLNNIIIAKLTTSNWPNILSNIWRFDTIASWKMLKKKFET